MNDSLLIVSRVARNL